MIYQSPRKFRIEAATVSHSMLILRSIMQFDEDNAPLVSAPFNIDIEFCGVEYLEMPRQLDGLSIALMTNAPDRLKQFVSRGPGLHLFCLHSKSDVFYIVAAGFQIGTNTWEYATRLENLDLIYDEILATS
jgi:hypothetical protein